MNKIQTINCVQIIRYLDGLIRDEWMLVEQPDGSFKHYRESDTRPIPKDVLDEANLQVHDSGS